jgi:apolipoprotein N-acyltransferase
VTVPRGLTGAGRAASLAALSAVAFGCAYPPAGWWPLVVPAVPLLALTVARPVGEGGAPRASFPWRVALAVAAVGVVKWLALHWWLLQVTEAGTAALAVYCTLHELLALWLLAACARAAPARVPWALLVPLAFGASEAFRALVLFDGYPWFRWGHPLVELPVLVQCADLGGEAVASLLVLAVGGAAVDLAMARGRARGARAGVAVACAAVAASACYGAWRLSQAPQGQGPGVLLVQTNLATSNKVAWAAKDQVRDVPEFAELTLRGAIDSVERGRPVALVAWPETMLAGHGLEPETIELQERNGWFPGDRFRQVVSGLSQRTGVPVIVGSAAYLGLRQDGDRFRWDRQFNSAYLVGAGPPPYPRYDKVFLAPFGETMPYISNWDWLERALLSLGAAGMTFDLDRGGDPVRFGVPWNGSTLRVATPICFEDAMSWVTLGLVFPASGGRERAVDLLVNITNDGWYGWFDAGRAQHLQLARFRCIETRTPMVRAANTGLCAGIDSSGRIVAGPTAPRTAAWLHASPPLDGRRPPFASAGEVPSIVLMLTCLAVACAPLVRRRPSVAPGAAMLALPLTACLAALVVGCSQDSQPLADQPWSSRSQSVQPTGDVRLSEGRAAPETLPVESSGDSRASAVTLLRNAASSPVPMFRANACEALNGSASDLQVVAAPLLADPNRGVRFVAAMEVGRARIAELADAVQPLLVDESESVRAAAIYALTRLGRPVDPSPLGTMVRSDDPEIRSNAYLVLGELGNRSAIPMIRDSLGKGMRQVNPARVRVVELQAAEALVRLGEADGIEPIRAALYAPGEQSEFTALAAQQVGRLRDDGSRPILMRLIDGTGISARPTEVRICCAAALAQISPSDRPSVVKFARTLLQDREPSVRAQAAIAMGTAGGPAVVPELEGLLMDRFPQVQLAAAKAILAATSAH